MIDQETLNLFGRLGISLAIGMLVGLQREQASAALAGLRTFSLVAISGTISALIDQHFQSNGSIFAASVIAVGAVVVVSEWRLAKANNADIGTTTAIAILVVFTLGAYVAQGKLIVAVAISVSVAALLQFKPELHSIAHKLGNRDMRAIIQFAVFSCVILPVLPNREMGPLQVFNPFNIWLMVVLIVGISLAGYICYKFFGETAGVIVGGILGGSISSTATALSFSRNSQKFPETTGVSTTVIVIASSVVFVRVLIELAVVAPGHWWQLGLPIVLMLVSCVFASTIAWLIFRGQKNTFPEPTNPSDFLSAIMFGGIYALVLFGLSATREYLNNDALYPVAAISGLTDMDAITLSLGRMVAQNENSLNVDVGWRLLVTASISNLLFKAGIVATIGGQRLFRQVFFLFLFPIVCGSLLLLFW